MQADRSEGSRQRLQIAGAGGQRQAALCREGCWRLSPAPCTHRQPTESSALPKATRRAQLPGDYESLACTTAAASHTPKLAETCSTRLQQQQHEPEPAELGRARAAAEKTHAPRRSHPRQPRCTSQPLGGARPGLSTPWLGAGPHTSLWRGGCTLHTQGGGAPHLKLSSLWLVSKFQDGLVAPRAHFPLLSSETKGQLAQ